MKKLLSLVLVLCVVFSCIAFAEEAEPTYTYNVAMSVFPTNWNPHQSQTADDSEVLDWISAGFYRFDYNETFDGYKMVPDMATEYPIDVTADYVGQFGLTEESTKQAWLIKLRDDIKWEDGTTVTAYEIAESAKRLLDPLAQNYRADSMYSGNVVIHNAQNYLYAGQHAYSNMISENYGPEEYVAVEAIAEMDIVLHAADGASWGSNSLEDYYGAGYLSGDVQTAYETVVQPAYDEDGNAAITPEMYTVLCDVVAQLHGYENAEAYAADAGDYAYQEAQELLYVGSDYPELDWSEVGYFATSDTELVMVLDKPCEGFYLMYGMPNYLVNTKLYDECTTITDGIYTNNYGTSAETTMSYGPYKLTSFQSDKIFVLEKNDQYYAYNDVAKDQYQATSIVYNFVAEASTRLEMFLNGQLDSYGLQKDDMETYAASDYCYYSDGDSIFAMVFNPDVETLAANQALAGEHINKTILTVKEFRMAMAYAMNRAEFCLATSPTNGPAFALYSSQIIADPENGIAYRATDEAKQVIVNFWGLADEIGEDKLYADVDEAIDSISGYNLEQARVYFDKAYDIAIEQGLMTEEDTVQIIVGTPNLTSAFYNSGYDYIVNNYTEAVKGTKLEGKLTFTRDGTLGNAFSDALKANNVDMLFGVGWTGSTFDPYNLFQVFVSPSYQYDSHYDATADFVTIELNGVEYTADAYTWYESMQGVGTEITAKVNGEDTTLVLADNAEKIIVLAALENNYLQVYDYIPLMNDASASLKSMKVEFFTEDEVFPMGRGGVRLMTFNYSDAEWEAFVAENGGTLNYK